MNRSEDNTPSRNPDQQPAASPSTARIEQTPWWWWWWVGTPGSRLRRWKFFATGVLAPALCIGTVLISGLSLLDAPWQSGNLEHYVQLLLDKKILKISLPLIMFSVFCLSWWLYRPSASSSRLVRTGIYSGAVLAIQYLVLLTIVTDFASFVAAPMVLMELALFAVLLRFLFSKYRQFQIIHLMGLTAVVSVLVALVLAQVRDATGGDLDALEDGMTSPMNVALFTLGWIYFPWLVGGTAVNCLTYCRAAVEVFQQARAASRVPAETPTDLPDRMLLERRNMGIWIGIGIGTSWLVAWGVTWKLSIEAMLVEYSKLPTTNPNCYVSGAAASGHRQFVRAELREDGAVVNQQMRRLKLLELAGATAFPRLHRIIRCGYDVLGPTLARGCRRCVWFADATYVLLKPLEWQSELLRRGLGIAPDAVDEIYGKGQRMKENG